MIFLNALLYAFSSMLLSWCRDCNCNSLVQLDHSDCFREKNAPQQGLQRKKPPQTQSLYLYLGHECYSRWHILRHSPSVALSGWKSGSFFWTFSFILKWLFFPDLLLKIIVTWRCVAARVSKSHPQHTLQKERWTFFFLPISFILHTWTSPRGRL